MSKLSDLINAEDGFLVKLRGENIFDESKYLEIKNQQEEAVSLMRKLQ